MRMLHQVTQFNRNALDAWYHTYQKKKSHSSWILLPFCFSASHTTFPNKHASGGRRDIPPSFLFDRGVECYFFLLLIPSEGGSSSIEISYSCARGESGFEIEKTSHLRQWARESWPTSDSINLQHTLKNFYWNCNERNLLTTKRLRNRDQPQADRVQQVPRSMLELSCCQTLLLREAWWS